MPAVITSSSELLTEWKTFRRYITNQPREDIKEQGGTGPETKKKLNTYL